jgi:hypothetical protein
MAAKVLRFDRRPKGSAPRESLTAASEPISDPKAQFKQSMSRRGDDWQSLGWEMYDRVGELRYYVGWQASSCSRCRFVASAIDEDTGKPTGSIPDDDPNGARVKEIIRSIAGGPLGQSQMVRRMAESLAIPGEVWVAILDVGMPKLPDGTPQMLWIVVTREEVKTAATGSLEVELPSGEKHEFDPVTDAIFRIWRPRARRAMEADSPIRAALDPLHEIVRTTKTISNASKSRLIGNGVMFVPTEMSLPATQGPTSDKTGVADQTAVVGTPAVKQLSELLWQVASVAYDDDNSMAALIPLIVSAPGEHIPKVNHIKFDNQVTQISIQVRNDAVSRLAMALDVSPERLLGLGSNTNHWTAWQISDEDVQLHVVPVMELICQGLNEQVVNKVLAAEGLDPNKYTLWYDASGLVADPDKSASANAAFQMGQVQSEAYLEMLGLPSGSGYDLETDEGWQQWARDQVTKNPQLLLMLRPWLGKAVEKMPELPSSMPGEGQPPPQEGPVIPPRQVEGRPHTPDSQDDARGGQAQAATVRDDKLMVLAQRMLVNRALELAGKRRRRPDNHARLRDIPACETHRYLPPVPTEDIGRLIAGWDEALASEVVAGLNIDTEELRAAAYAVIKRELTAQIVDGEVI